MAAANLTGAAIAGVTGTANLTGAKLTNISAADANLGGDTLTGAQLTGAHLGAYLFDVVSGQITGTPASLPEYWMMAGGYLIGQTADLANAVLAGLDLESAEFGSPNLTNANLANADLHEAQFSSANVSGAQLAGANLAGVEAHGVTGTPASLPAHWVLYQALLLGPGAFIINTGLPGANLSRPGPGRRLYLRRRTHERELRQHRPGGRHLQLRHKPHRINVRPCRLCGHNLAGRDLPERCQLQQVLAGASARWIPRRRW